MVMVRTNNGVPPSFQKAHYAPVYQRQTKLSQQSVGKALVVSNNVRQVRKSGLGKLGLD